MVKALLVSIAICIGATGCAIAPRLTAEQIGAADYGQEVRPSEAESIIRQRLSRTLFDPESLRFRGPTKTTKYWAVDEGGNYQFGWLALYGVNAKNRMGGYTGERMYAVMIRNGIVLGEFEDKGTHWFPDPNDHRLYR